MADDGYEAHRARLLVRRRTRPEMIAALATSLAMLTWAGSSAPAGRHHLDASPGLAAEVDHSRPPWPPAPEFVATAVGLACGASPAARSWRRRPRPAAGGRGRTRVASASPRAARLPSGGCRCHHGLTAHAPATPPLTMSLSSITPLPHDSEAPRCETSPPRGPARREMRRRLDMLAGWPPVPPWHQMPPPAPGRWCG